MVKIRSCRQVAYLGLASVALTVSGCYGFTPCDMGRGLCLGSKTTRKIAGELTTAPRGGVHDGQRAHWGVSTSSRDTSLRVASHTNNNSNNKNWFTAALEQAFSNEHFAAPPEGVRATARHILLDSPEVCHEAIHRIQSGQLSFEEATILYSTCPSKFDNGSLGTFHRGTMVPEFDALVFDPQTPLRQVVGPVHTPFGYHIVIVDKRSGV